MSIIRLLDSKGITLEPLVTKNLKLAMATSTYLLIITLNVNGLNAPIKRHRVTEWIKKTRPVYMLPTRNSLQNKRHTQTESKGMEKKYFMQLIVRKKQELQCLYQTK